MAFIISNSFLMFIFENIFHVYFNLCLLRNWFNCIQILSCCKVIMSFISFRQCLLLIFLFHTYYQLFCHIVLIIVKLENTSISASPTNGNTLLNKDHFNIWFKLYSDLLFFWGLCLNILGIQYNNIFFEI